MVVHVALCFPLSSTYYVSPWSCYVGVLLSTLISVHPLLIKLNLQNKQRKISQHANLGQINSSQQVNPNKRSTS